VNRKADFLRNESIRITNRIDSNRELECSFVDRIYDGRDASLPGTYIVDYTSVDCNLLTPLLRFFVDFLYKCLYSCAAVDQISTVTVLRAVRTSVVAELLVQKCHH